MRKIAQMALAGCLMALIFFPAAKLSAQEPDKTPEAKTPEPPAHFYHLEFVVQETGSDGKPLNSRTYSGTLSTGRTERGFSTRTGSRVPITSSLEGNKNTQFQYIDVGVNIDAHDARELGDKLALYIIVDISSLAGTQNISGVSEPVVRQNKWQAPVLVPIGKPTTVFTSDVLDSKGGMQLVLTASPVK